MTDQPRNPRARKLYTSPEKKAEWKARRPYRWMAGHFPQQGIWGRTRRFTGGRGR